MSKPRWHPLPVDSQVVAAIQDRREQLTLAYKQQVQDNTTTEDSWAWHHIFTVLDHAEKIFQLPVEQLTSNIDNNDHA